MPGRWDDIARFETETLTAARNAVRPVVGDVAGLTDARAVYAEALRRLGVPARDRAAMCQRLGTAKAAFRILRDRQKAAAPAVTTQLPKEGSNNHG